jgi:hypothetical protein
VDAVKRLGRFLVGSAALAAALLGGGCRSSAPVGGPTAECPVCRYEGDLACLCVRIEPDTPSSECAGERYYFCSRACREEFLRHPERYRE